ncbi:DNA-damage-inducible protein J OS=Castellaniella defragrans OX=75697 GN=HNR28_003140 PE=3 SV=1 [Castellaniella defragrans]
MAATTMVHVRVDERVKEEASRTLESVGLTVSDAVRVFLMRVIADKGLPFEVRAPNTASRAAMEDARGIAQAHRARFANATDLVNSLEKACGE